MLKRLPPVIAILAALIACAADADAAGFVAGTSIRFDDVAQGRALLASRDDFVQRLSPFDRAARLKSAGEVDERQYLDFVGTNVLPWGEPETKAVEAALRQIQPGLAALHLPLPATVELIETTGLEEGQAAYTRGQAIILPRTMLAPPDPDLTRIIAHEFFHIVSRVSPALREQLYAAIGFVKCNEIDLPPGLAAAKITNPDAPRNDHRISVRTKGRQRWAVPVLFASPARYDPQRGGEFFNYLQFRFLLVEPAAAPGQWTATADSGGGPVLLSLDQAGGFFAQVGHNTDYLIHPEEILADNFALIVLGKHDVPSPQVQEKIRAVLGSRQTAPATRTRSKD